MAKKKNTKPKGINPDQFNALTIGPNAAAVKSKATKGQWRRIVKTAHKQGFKVDSYVNPDTPAPMKERTNEWLQSEARRRTASAYKPIEQELTDRNARIKAVDAKRTTDNKYYTQWLMDRRAAATTQASTDAEALRTAAQQAEQNTVTQYQGLHDHLMGQTFAGQTSQPSQDTHVATALDSQATRDLGLAGADTAAAAQHAVIQGNHQQDMTTNALAYAASIDARRQADTMQQLADLATDQKKTVLQKAADRAKAAADLLQNEQSKADSNRNFAAASVKLGLQGRALDISAGKGAETARHNRADEKAANQRLAEQTRRAANEPTKYGYTKGEWAKLPLQTRLAAVKAYNDAHGKGKGRGSTGSKDPEIRFQAGLNLLKSARRSNGAPYDPGYVASHRDLVIARVATSGKLTTEMATRIVDAFIATQGQTTTVGSYKQYANPGTPTTGAAQSPR